MSHNATFKTLIAGGGPAALEAALTLRELAPEARVEMLVADRDFVYRPLSVVEPFAQAGVRRYPYVKLAEIGIDVHQDRMLRVEPDERLVVTSHGTAIGYDALLVATGARQSRAIAHCLTFGGVEDIERMHGLVQDIEGGYVRSIAFAVPPGAAWTLPLYELALQTAQRANDMCLDEVSLTLASHEQRPLAVFGDAASELMEGLLERRGVTFVNREWPPVADRIVALPVPAGPRVAGLPADEAGFLVVDEEGRVGGVRRVWAAGDCTNYPIKQGGLATQQAAVAAASIATHCNAAPPAESDDLILRAMFVDDRQAYFLRRRLDGVDPGQASSRALWWPPSKIAGRRLAPYLDRIDARESRRGFERKHTEGSAIRRLFVPKVVP